MGYTPWTLIGCLYFEASDVYNWRAFQVFRSNMKDRRILVAVLVMLHMTLLAAYTFPSAWVPDLLRIWSGVLARPLFHQQWELFAPDPPLCSCEAQVSFEADLWRSLHQHQDHYLEQRMVQNIARHLQQAVRSDVPVNSFLAGALREACSPYGDPAQARFRLMEHCITDPQRPAVRELRLTPIQLP